MADERLPPESRVRHQRDFDRVYREDAFAADDTLVVRGCRNGLGHSRLGVAVSRKVGSAVVRNRWKRLIREAFRCRRETLPVGLDLVVRPRRGAAADYRAILASLPRLARRVERRLNREPQA